MEWSLLPAPIGVPFIGLNRQGNIVEAYIPTAIAPCALDLGGDELDLTHWIPFPDLPIKE